MIMEVRSSSLRYQLRQDSVLCIIIIYNSKVNVNHYIYLINSKDDSDQNSV